MNQSISLLTQLSKRGVCYGFERYTMTSIVPAITEIHKNKRKAVADDNINVDQIMMSVFDRIEHCGKRRKCWLPAFSPLPTMFSKHFCFRVVKSQFVW